MKMELAEGFKDTEIGRIPKEWKVVRLGDEGIAEIRSNRVISGFEKVAFIPMELIPDSCIFANYELRPMDEVKSFTYCERGDLLLAKITPSLENGKQGIVPDDVPNGFALATTEVFPIVPKGVDKLYLFYLLKFPKFRNKIIASMIGTTGRQRASKESVEKLKIPLPPLPEQRKIAEILSTVDDAIQKVDEAIARTERLKRGLMQKLLTKGIGHKEFEDTEIGRIPKEWEVVKLKEVVEKIKAGGTPLTTNPEYWNGDIPFVKIEDITSSTKYLSKTITFVSRKGLENSSAWIVPKNSLLLAMYGSLGEVAITKIPVTTNQAILAIIPKKDKCETEFLYYWFLYFKPQWKKFAKPTTQANLTAEIIREACIPLPPLPEQRKIAEILSTVDKKSELERKRKEKLEHIRRGLMNDLLTGKRRIKV